jgi:hypothetical protein
VRSLGRIFYSDLRVSPSTRRPRWETRATYLLNGGRD